MKSRWSLRGQNRGASLIAVLVALIFVTAIAAIVMNITITNIQMKEVEQSGKKNFYSAEAVMDELTVGLNDIAAECMQEAYTEILTDYRNIMVSGSNIQAKFTELYMEKLTKRFWDGVPDTWKDKRIKTDPLDNEIIIYVMGYYNPADVKSCITESGNDVYWATEQAEATFTADYVEGLFTLENVKITYQEANGYETTISTDMVFHTPELNFDGSNIIKDFMKYSLIADNMVEINAAGITVNGSVYAGTGGIKSTLPGTAVFSGNNIVTRGDIIVENGTSMTIGSGTTRIWAENIQTTGKGSASSLILNGNCYIADDLMLNGQNSTVTLYGNYYGYNFQEDYTSAAAQTVTDSAFSSAMMINAKNCRLDMTGLDYLMLAGRTFISRGSKGNTENTDVMLGESVAVRTNQLAYYVPERFLDVTDTSNAKFTMTGAEEYSAYTGVPDILSYLNPSHPITTYHFRDNNVASQRYYLNFASEQLANDFFAAYYAANGDKVNAYAESYAGENAIIISDTMLYTLKGDIMYKNAEDAELQEKKITISPGDWEPGAGGSSAGIYWTYANRLAVTYKSLQMYLEDSHTGVTSENVRFKTDTGVIDKSVEPLVYNLVDVEALKSDLPQSGGTTNKCEEVTELTATTKRLIAVVNNEGTDTYVIAPEYTEGIVIATGNVQVEGSFTGMIISGDTISFTAGASVAADEIMVSQLFKEDIAKGEDAVFATYFIEYNTLSESVIGIVEIDEYLTYDNWTKNGN